MPTTTTEDTMTDSKGNVIRDGDKLKSSQVSNPRATAEVVSIARGVASCRHLYGNADTDFRIDQQNMTRSKWVKAD